ncbi:MAG: hypothetical protein LQ342_007827 [Letrouitia transgressa]|nr:MAG: hypothetical protein LQ342_007827 [Letrouitia transgressa]
MSSPPNPKKGPKKRIPLEKFPKPSEIKAEMAWLNFAIALRLDGRSRRAGNNGLLAASLEVIFGIRKNEVALFKIFRECEKYRQVERSDPRKGKIAKMCDYWDPRRQPKDAVKDDVLTSMARLFGAAVYIIYLSKGLHHRIVGEVVKVERVPNTDKNKKAHSIPLGWQMGSAAQRMDWEWPWINELKPEVGVDGMHIALGKPWCLTEHVGKHLEKFAQMHLGGELSNFQIVPYFPKSGKEKRVQRLLESWNDLVVRL